MYYVYMAFLLAEIMTTIGIIISSYCSQRSMPNKGKIHFLMIAAMLSPMLLLSLRILKILKGDDPDILLQDCPVFFPLFTRFCKFFYLFFLKHCLFCFF